MACMEVATITSRTRGNAKEGTASNYTLGCDSYPLDTSTHPPRIFSVNKHCIYTEHIIYLFYFRPAQRATISRGIAAKIWRRPPKERRERCVCV